MKCLESFFSAGVVFPANFCSKACLKIPWSLHAFRLQLIDCNRQRCVQKFGLYLSVCLPVYQNISKNLVHGANIAEQPGGLSLHRLRVQHHIPSDIQATQAPLLHPLVSHVPQCPSAVSRTSLDDMDHFSAGGGG